MSQQGCHRHPAACPCPALGTCQQAGAWLRLGRKAGQVDEVGLRAAWCGGGAGRGGGSRALGVEPGAPLGRSPQGSSTQQLRPAKVLEPGAPALRLQPPQQSGPARVPAPALTRRRRPPVRGPGWIWRGRLVTRPRSSRFCTGHMAAANHGSAPAWRPPASGARPAERGPAPRRAGQAQPKLTRLMPAALPHPPSSSYHMRHGERDSGGTGAPCPPATDCSPHQPRTPTQLLCLTMPPHRSTLPAPSPCLQPTAACTSEQRLAPHLRLRPTAVHLPRLSAGPGRLLHPP